MSDRAFVFCLVGYLLIGALTFGQVHYRLEASGYRSDDYYPFATFAAAGWPIYWPFRIADELFDPRGFRW